MMSQPSSRMATRSAIGTPKVWNSWGWCPVPTPSTTRPPLSASSMPISCSTRSGWCSGSTATAGPSRIRSVCPAQNAAMVKGEAQTEWLEKWCSANQATS